MRGALGKRNLRYRIDVTGISNTNSINTRLLLLSAGLLLKYHLSSCLLNSQSFEFLSYSADLALRVIDSDCAGNPADYLLSCSDLCHVYVTTASFMTLS